MRSEICYCVWVLNHKLWGKTLIDKKIRSQNWWHRRLDTLINSPTIELHDDWQPPSTENDPIPYEVEFPFVEKSELTESELTELENIANRVFWNEYESLPGADYDVDDV